MSNCVNCQAELQPEWKFCIYCGTAVAPARPVGEQTGEGPKIPGAIRPNIDGPHPDHADLDHAPKRRLDIPLLVGILLGAAGIALVIYMVIVLNGSA